MIVFFFFLNEIGTRKLSNKSYMDFFFFYDKDYMNLGVVKFFVSGCFSLVEILFAKIRFLFTFWFGNRFRI